MDGTRGGREELQGFGVGADDVNEQVGGPAVGPRGAVAMVLEPLEERRVGGLLVVLLGRRGGRGGRVGGQNCIPPLRLVVVQLGSGRVKLAKLGECGLSRGSARAIGQCLDGPADGAPEGQAVGPPPRALGMELGELRCREGGEARPVLGEARAIFLSALRGAVQEHVEVAQPEVLDARLDVPPDRGTGRTEPMGSGREEQRREGQEEGPAEQGARPLGLHRRGEDGLEHGTQGGPRGRGHRWDDGEWGGGQAAQEVEGVAALAGRKQRSHRQGEARLGDGAGDTLGRRANGARSRGAFMGAVPFAQGALLATAGGLASRTGPPSTTTAGGLALAPGAEAPGAGLSEEVHRAKVGLTPVAHGHLLHGQDRWGAVPLRAGVAEEGQLVARECRELEAGADHVTVLGAEELGVEGGSAAVAAAEGAQRLGAMGEAAHDATLAQVHELGRVFAARPAVQEGRLGGRPRAADFTALGQGQLVEGGSGRGEVLRIAPLVHGAVGGRVGLPVELPHDVVVGDLQASDGLQDLATNGDEVVGPDVPVVAQLLDGD